MPPMPRSDNFVPWCKAFPEGIPPEIAQGDEPHTEPFPGDNGIQFEKEKRLQ